MPSGSEPENVSQTSADLAPRFLQGQGIAERPFEECRRLLPAFFTSVRFTNDPLAAIQFLSLLTWPATRHVAFRGDNRTTVLVNNSRGGSDYNDYVCLLPRHLECRFARVLCTPGRIWTDGVDQQVMQYQATIFDLRDRSGECIRSVTCMNDGGRWTFREQGLPHPVESSFPYDHRRKRQRFTPEHMRRLLDAYGLPLAGPTDFQRAGQYLLATSAGADQAATCTLEEADDPAYGYYVRGLSWCNHLATHFSSAIFDLERCVQLNPAYEPKVRPLLERAYRQRDMQGG